MRVLFFGTYDERRHPRVRVLIEGFRAHGDEVLECNEPLGVDTRARVEALRAPWRVASILARVARAWVTLVRRARALPVPDVVVVGYLGTLDVLLARLLFRRSRVVLDDLAPVAGTARDRGASRWLAQALALADRLAARAAHLVVVDTDEHRALLPRGVRSVVVPVGAPDAWFASRARQEAPDLRVVFFGLYTPLQGATVIGEAIAMLDGEPVAFTMIGDGQERAAAERTAGRNPRARWVDWVEPDALPETVAAHDVCLGIFGAGEKARRVVPNKVFQGAAAGCVVVTADTEPQRRALGEAAVFVPPGDAKALAEVLRELAHDRARVSALQQAARALAGRRFRPGAVVEPLRAVLA